MSLYFLPKFRFRIFVFISVILFNSGFLSSQIRVFERPDDKEQRNSGLFFESDTRKKINLNGEWEVSFNEGMNYSRFVVPLACDFEGNSLFKRKFSVPEEYLKNYSFIFVAEGIEYESFVRINNNFVSNHTGGSLPVIAALPDGILNSSNEIEIKIHSGLNYKNTSPLSDQINYSCVYGGINKDIYIIAVPKLFVLKNNIKYTIDNLLSVKLKNIISIQSSGLSALTDSSGSNEFFLQTKVIRKSDSAEAGSSIPFKFNIGDNNSLKAENDVTLNSPVIWSPETPELYIVRTVITNKDGKIIDENITETGFTNLTLKNNQVYQSGRQIKLNGINYYEDQPKFASALNYKTTENDLKNIKLLGFNAVRVPGRCAHPYIVSICSNIGLYLFQEIPLNEISGSYLKDEKYVRLNLSFLSELIERDINAPCIIAWGIGNDFDVSDNHSLNYVRSAKMLIDSLNKRFCYYTSRAFNEDICSEEVDFVGINYYGKNSEIFKTTVAQLSDKSKPVSNRKNGNLMISYYGLDIQNLNTNGFSDIRSQEAQMKFFSECYPKIPQGMFCGFISSYADWNSSNPLNYPLDSNRFLKTSGLYTYNREQKRSADFVKRLLHGEDLPRIQEGNFVKDFPFVFIAAGLITILIFIYFLNRDKKFRSNLLRCIYKPTYFFALVKDQMIITTGYNILLSFSISIGIALFFSSVFYFYRDNNSFDMILAKVFTNDTTKITFSEILNNKLYMCGLLTAVNLLLTFLTAVFLYFISFYTKGKSYFKNIYTVCVWSTLPMILFLFLGTILYKIAESNPVYIKISAWVFFILYILYLNRILIGVKTLFDIRTGKVYLYGFIIIFIIFAVLYFYFLMFSGAIETINLVSNLTQ